MVFIVSTGAVVGCGCLPVYLSACEMTSGEREETCAIFDVGSRFDGFLTMRSEMSGAGSWLATKGCEVRGVVEVVRANRSNKMA